jgi:PAS domain S-box-containing protein
MKDKGSVENFEYEARGLNGKCLWLSMNARVREKLFSDGTFIIDGFTADISERKQAEEMMRENRERLNLILDTVPQSVFWKDLEGRYLGCNRVFSSAVGLDDPIQIVGKTDFDLPWPSEEAEAYRADDREVIENNHPKLHIIEQLQQADGTRLWIDTSKVPLSGANGRPFGVLGIYENITERKRTEEAKAKLEVQLQQAQKFEAIGTLAGGIAHDFNNLLMGIQGRTSLLSFDLEPSHPHWEHVNAIDEYIRSATSLTKQLLGLARGGKYEVNPVDMNELVHDSSAMFGRTKKEIRIHTKGHASPLVVEADRGQIEQVLLNMYIC